MPFTRFTDLDFDQIKTLIKTYLKANSTFTDFDFEGSNFSVLIDTLAYNTYITAFNSNMIVNESFLDSATIRSNVVSLARNVGYVPRSKTCAKANISFSVTLPQPSALPSQIVLKSGLVCVGTADNTTYIFSIPENIITNVDQNSSIAAFNNIDVYQGTLITKKFTVDNTERQKFILDNQNIDTSTIVVKVNNVEYKLIDNITQINSKSEIFLIQEIEDEKYQLLFGDGILGKKLENGTTIDVSYIVTDGSNGNGPSVFSFSGVITNVLDVVQNPVGTVNITTNSPASGGKEIETIDSIKYFAPRLYSSQYRAVTTRDYESIIKLIYPDAESVSVTGGEELDPPEYGNVYISIKPKNSFKISDFTKQNILSKLKKYSVIGINPKIIDLKTLFVEIESAIYYDPNKVTNISELKTTVVKSLEAYANSIQASGTGGRFRYSRVLQAIDNVDSSITSNITRVKIRRNLNAVLNNFAQYELCFGNQFHKEINKYNIKSTGFGVFGETSTCYFVDVPQQNSDIGELAIVKPMEDLQTFEIVKKSVGQINYKKGEILINTINITSTVIPNGIIEIQAYPESNDVVGLKDLYVIFDVNQSVNNINMIRDTIVSGEQISGVNFQTTSSYSNGRLIR